MLLQPWRRAGTVPALFIHIRHGEPRNTNKLFPFVVNFDFPYLRRMPYMDRLRYANNPSRSYRADVVGVYFDPDDTLLIPVYAKPAPTLPRVSARATEAPPWSRPAGCIVL